MTTPADTITDTSAVTEPATHARTVNGGTPQLFPWPHLRAEVDSAQSGTLRKKVRQMYGANGRWDIHYKDGRHVVIRPATDQDREDAARAAAIIAHAAAHACELKPAEFGPDVTLDGMPADQWLDAMCCQDEPQTCPRPGR